MMDNYSNEKEIRGACCGRSFPQAAPKCNWSCGPTTEYCGCALGRIKKDADPCKACAVIPAVTVETVDGITNLANCFVHVTGINTTFYIDDKHRPMITWAGDVEVDLPANIQTDEQWQEFIHSFNLKSQFLYVKIYDEENHVNLIDTFYFDKTGKIYFAGQFEEIVGA